MVAQWLNVSVSLTASANDARGGVCFSGSSPTTVWWGKLLSLAPPLSNTFKTLLQIEG